MKWNTQKLKMAKSYFRNAEVVRDYVKTTQSAGLWQSEKIVFEKFVEPTDEILDLGCGAGRTTFGLYDLGYTKIIGLDYSKEMIKESQRIAKERKVDISFLERDARDLPFENNRFHVCIFSFNGLMNLSGRDNRRKVFQEVSRVLKPNGYFIFTAHDIENPEFLEYWADEWEKWEEGTHDKRLLEFGDVIFSDEDIDEELEGFIHCPHRLEILEELDIAGLTPVYEANRSEICQETPTVEEYSDECRFWVVKKVVS